MNEELTQSKSGMAFRRSGGGPVVVLLHGIPGSGEAWRPAAEMLPASLDVIIPDLLGFGGSIRPTRFEDLGAQTQASALEELLDELQIESATVVGHDFGGSVALSLVGRRPAMVQAIGLLATNAFPDPPVPFPLTMASMRIVGPLARRIMFSGPALSMMLREGVGPATSPPDPLTYLGDREQRRAIGAILAGSLTRLTEIYEPLEATLCQIDVPAFVGWGDHDPYLAVTQGQRTAYAAGSELRIYEGAGHFLPHERPTELAANIIELVERRSRR